MEPQGLISYGWQMAFIGMFAVFGFLWMLTILIDVSSYLIRLTQKDNKANKIATAIAIALHQEGK